MSDVTIAREILAGAHIHGHPDDPMPADVRDGMLHEAAERRTVDVRHIHEGLSQAWCSSQETYDDPETQAAYTSRDPELLGHLHDEGYHLDGLPLLSPPRIGLPGLWLLDTDVAAVVTAPDESDTSLVLTVVRYRNLPGHLYVNPFSALVRADGDSYGITLWCAVRSLSVATAHLAESHDPGDELTRTLWVESQFAPAAVLMACGIAQADPTVVHTTRPPAKLQRAASRRGRPHPPVTTSIDLPGLRYDKRAGAFTAKRGDGVAWHMVRGHWRRLTAEQYRVKRGQSVWVRPHARGRADLGRSTRGYRVGGGAA